MIFGVTNAGGGGKMKYLTGSFMSSKTATQSSFTVSGLDFEPKVVVIYGGNVTQLGSTSNSALNLAYADFERGTGFYAYGTNLPSKLTLSKNLTVSGGNGTYTITASSYFFSNITSSSRGAYSTFYYYIYG